MYQIAWTAFILTLVTGQPKHDTLSCLKLENSLHYSLSPFTHTITLSLDSVTDQSGSVPTDGLRPCHVSLIGCDECLLRVTVRDSRNHWDCGQVFLRDGNAMRQRATAREGICYKNCSYVLLYEPAYRDLNMTYFRSAINNIITYKSTSSRVTIETCYNDQSKTFSTLEIEVSTKRKFQEFTGSASDDVTSGYITSPNFPLGYARQGEKYLYYIHNTDKNGTIRLVFEDWDVAQTTRLLFYETDHETEYPLSVHYGYYFRPVLRLSGPSLLIVFEPDITSSSSVVRSINFGFRALFEFLPGSGPDDVIETDCGGHIRYVTGGTMLYRASHWTSGSRHDCIWVLHKSSAFKHIQLHIWNMSMSAFDHDLSVTIRGGLTSVSDVIHQYTSSLHAQQNATGAPVGVYSNERGFYIRLRGTLYQNDTFFFTFVSYNDPFNATSGGISEPRCRQENEFLCPGSSGFPGLCIDRHFLCDGHAHCPGLEDESSVCSYGHVEPDVESKRIGVLEPICRQRDFRCLSGSRCIPETALCDKWRDCPDGSDEYYCEPNNSRSNAANPQCGNGSRLCEKICVPDVDVCSDKRCVLIWYNYGCDIFGVSEPVVEIEWSLILPLCFAIFCVFILLGIALIRLRRQPKFYIDPLRRTRRCRRVPIVSRVVRCHAPCSATSSCSGGSGMGLLSRSTSASGGSSVVDSRTMSPSPFGHYLGSPAFDVSLSPSRLEHSPCLSSASQEPNTIFNFDRIQTSIT